MTRFLKLLAFIPLLTLAPAFALQRVELLPETGRSYLRVSNSVEFWDELKKSSLGRLWADPLFQDFIGNPDQDVWNELLMQGDSEAENEVFLQQIKMLTGEVVFAFDQKSEGIYIIAAMSNEDFQRSLELDERLLDIEAESFEILRDDFQGVEIIQHIENGGEANELSSWQAHLNGTLLFGYSREWLEQSIVRVNNEEIEEPEGQPVLDFNMPLGSFLRDLMEEEEDPQVERIFEAMGLLGIDALKSRVELFDDRMVIDNNVAIEDLERGVFALLDTEPSELPTVSFIPDNLATFEVGRFDLPSLWSEIPIFLTTAMPEAKLQFDMMLGLVQQQAGVQFEQDLFAHLGTKYLSYGTIVGETGRSIVALELEDGPAFKQGVESAFASPSMAPYVATALEITDFLDHQIYTVKNPNPDEQIAVALTDDYLLYGDPEEVRQVIRAMSSEAAANDAFERAELVRALRENVPPNAFGFGAIDWKKNMDVIVAEIAKPEYAGLITQQWLEQNDVMPPPDFSKLPDAAHIASFFNTSITYVEENEDGLHQRIILNY